MFDTHKDIQYISFQYTLYIIDIYFNIALTFEIESKKEMFNMFTGSKSMIYILLDICSNWFI